MKAQDNLWTGIEVVITALTRNQVVARAARGFESHPVRQKSAAIQTELRWIFYIQRLTSRILEVYCDAGFERLRMDIRYRNVYI